MKLHCRIKFIELKVLLDKLKEISVKILAKKAQQLLQNILNLNESKLLTVFFEDFLTKHLKSSKWRGKLIDGNAKSVRKIKEFVKLKFKISG